MTAQMDRVFDSMYKVMPMRVVTLKEAIGWDEVNGTPLYASDRTFNAKILDKPLSYDEVRQTWFLKDGSYITIWFRDFFERRNDVATVEELTQLANSVRGDVKEAEAEHYTRFVVDGVTLKYASHTFLGRPDGQLYAVRIILQAA